MELQEVVTKLSNILDDSLFWISVVAAIVWLITKLIGDDDDE